MSKQGQFTFTAPYRIGEGIAAEFTCRAEYEVTSPGRRSTYDPAYGNWMPAEPPEIDVTDIRVEVRMPDGTSRWEAPYPHIDRIIQDHINDPRVWAALIRDAEREIA